MLREGDRSDDRGSPAFGAGAARIPSSDSESGACRYLPPPRLLPSLFPLPRSRFALAVLARATTDPDRNRPGLRGEPRLRGGR
jgi:hypothetical protein